MTVKELIEAISKMPPQAQLQDVRLKVGDGWVETLTDVSWEGTHIQLEAH